MSVSAGAEAQHVPHTHKRGQEGSGHIGWFEHTIAGISSSIERAVFTEEHARKDGWLQAIDPRAKLVMFLVTVLAASLSNSLLALFALYGAILVSAWAPIRIRRLRTFREREKQDGRSLAAQIIPRLLTSTAADLVIGCTKVQ